MGKTGAPMSVLRGQFSSKLGFILASAGSAVGIGNLVGFPVMASKNGGGAFLLIYLVFIAFVCFPVMLAEIAMGRASQKSPVGAFDHLSDGNKTWRMIGGLGLITPFFIGVFYTVITVWIMIYMLQSAMGNLDELAMPDTFGATVSSPKMFIYLVPLLAILFLILGRGVKDGIEKASRIMMPTLIVMLQLLIAFVLTLDNASAGLSFYLIPEFSKIDSGVINSALNHGFFSLSLGMGILITYGSYLNKKENMVSSTRLVAVADTGVAFFAGLLVIPAVFAMDPSVNAEELSESSISLMFSYLPGVFLKLQGFVGYAGASVVATMFFMLVFFAALTSLVSITEIPIAYLMDEKEKPRREAIVYIATMMLVFILVTTVSFGMSDFFTAFLHYGGIDKSFFDLIYDVFYETILPLMGFIVCLFVCYRWKKHRMNSEVALADGDFRDSMLEKYVGFSLSTFIPLILLAVFANNVSRIYFAHNLFGF
jgi:NSS family neurotransmitter:Na+ symporter